MGESLGKQGLRADAVWAARRAEFEDGRSLQRIDLRARWLNACVVRVHGRNDLKRAKAL